MVWFAKTDISEFKRDNYKRFTDGGFIMNENCMLCENDKETLTLTTEDDRTVVCSIISIFAINAQKYIILVPEDSADGKGLLYRFALTGDGGPDLTPIPDDTEYDHAYEVFTRLTADQNFDE